MIKRTQEHTLTYTPCPYTALSRSEYFEMMNISLEHVKEIPELCTPQAFTTTDHDNNQITAFHPGAMMPSYENNVRDVPGVSIGIVSPDVYEGMLQNAKEFAEGGNHFIFHPGQAMPLSQIGSGSCRDRGCHGV